MRRRLTAQLLADHELEARPHLADRADLHVDEADGQRELADRVLGDVGRDLRRFLRPRNPDRAILLDRGKIRFQGDPREAVDIYKAEMIAPAAAAKELAAK